MSFWGVRAGSGGEREAYALERGVVVVGWDEVPDLNQVASRSDLKNVLLSSYKDEGNGTIANWTGQLFAFAKEMKEGDLVALPRKHTGSVAFGIVSGPYRLEQDAPEMAKHQRTVRWLDQDFPRHKLDEDIRFSLGSVLTVFQVRRNNAEERMRAVLDGRAPVMPPTMEVAEIAEAKIDIERQSRDQIIDHIGRKFRGHSLERLVEAILNAQGFVTSRTPPGADGGVDILAGRGQLGFEAPQARCSS